MLTIFLRTLLIMVLLIGTMRLMGKRQLGELEVSELIITLLLSEIAALPITDTNIPFSHAAVPVLTLASFEVLLSVGMNRFPWLKKIVTAPPTMIVKQGKLQEKELKRLRMSLDELLEEMRQQGFCDIDDVYYIIQEQTGKLTIIPKADRRPPTAKDTGLALPEKGIMHIIYENGRYNSFNLSLLGRDEAWAEKEMKKKGFRPQDVFYLLCDDGGSIRIKPIQKKDKTK